MVLLIVLGIVACAVLLLTAVVEEATRRMKPLPRHECPPRCGCRRDSLKGF